MYKGSLVTIEDLSNAQVQDILDLAEEVEKDRKALYGLGSRWLMASLFLEPSTRTRGSFEAAMKRLGGDTITTADARSSSVVKGESLADTIRIWSGYADLIVLRHPWEGAAQLAADYGDVPVINAGDGSHEHPTQTLLDLYTLRKEFGSLEGLKIVLCGDLKHGRTVHSLVYALLRFGANVIFVPGEGLQLPDHVLHKIEAEYGIPIQRVRNTGVEALYGRSTNNGDAAVDAIYMAPSQPHSLTLFDSLRIRIGRDESFAFYVTRRQTEREASDPGEPPKMYPRITPEVLHRAGFSNAVILHPLPRLDELSTEVDADRRSRYFQQARNGVPVRMALIALMLGLRSWSPAATLQVPRRPISKPEGGMRCANEGCVTQREPQSTEARFAFFTRPKVRLVCTYCDRETFPAFYSYPWGEVYHPIEEPPMRPIDASTFGLYADESSARASGLRQPKWSEETA